ncbi:MAG: purine-nucleoside phosphorylase, partial [Polyangiaceae bacterium]|nr:purine-nucleoside phosphorylase [Polyangiaceae bacterium]
MALHSQPPAPSAEARVDDTVFALRRHLSFEPVVGVVLGSGLGAFGDSLEGLTRVAYGDLPHMPVPAVPGHPGNFCFGHVEGVPVVCMQGRVHLYEGHPVETVVLGARAMARLGVRCVLITNAAGGLRPSWSPGDLMVVSDHLNLTGTSPLLGPNDDAVGPRFPDLTAAYDPGLRAALHSVARDAGVALREGVYAGMLGPQYETPAEIRMLRALGADAVGMSTVLEVIALRHMGVRVGA